MYIIDASFSQVIYRQILTLGILNRARENEIITLDETIDIIIIMKNNKFRISDKILEDFIESMKKEE